MPASLSELITSRAIDRDGEKTDDYVIVGSRVEEFDYPKGDTNVYTKYTGENGIKINSFIRKLTFAWELGDINILISGELTPG
ncbi:unnamed protein product, partial [marine sediment metagenome]